MNKTIKVPNGVTVRIVEAINGFKKKHGYWPTELALDATTIVVLATHYLTPLGFFLLQAKVRLVEGADHEVIAKGRSADEFDYGREGLKTKKYKHDARAWLGLDEERANGEEVN